MTNRSARLRMTYAALEILQKTRPLRGHRLGSFDMENCFGSISSTLASQIIENGLNEKIQQHTRIADITVYLSTSVIIYSTKDNFTVN